MEESTLPLSSTKGWNFKSKGAWDPAGRDHELGTTVEADSIQTWIHHSQVKCVTGEMDCHTKDKTDAGYRLITVFCLTLFPLALL